MRSLFLIAYLLNFFAQGRVAAQITRDGLIGYWSFDDGTASDSNASGHIVGQPAVVPGVHGKAIRFDGSMSYVNLGAPILNGLSQFTICFFMRPEAFGNRVSLVGQNDAVELGLDAGRLILWTPAGSTSVSFGKANAWTHVAATATASEVRLYLDGKLVASGTRSTSGSVGASTDTAKIGAGVMDSVGGYFRGSIDEVYVFRRALSDEDINLLSPRPQLNALLNVASVEPGPIYLNGLYTGKLSPTALTIPYADQYLLSVGLEGSGAAASPRYDRQEVSVPPATQSILLSGKNPVLSRRWKILLLSVRNMYLEGNQVAVLTDDDIRNVYAGVEEVNRIWVKPYSYGLAEWSVEQRTVEDVYGRLSGDQIDATRFLQDAKLTALIPQYDAIFFFWPRVPSGSTSYQCCGAVGWEWGVSVPNSWGRAFGWSKMQIWLHEWLHVAERHYARQGYDIGLEGLHGTSAHGYGPDPQTTSSWLIWYKDFMRGLVKEGGSYVGIPPEAWAGSTRTSVIESPADPSMPVFTAGGIVNGASMKGAKSSAPAAPGQIVSIFGSNLGPPKTGTQATFDGSGRLPIELAGTKVFFEGIQAPLVFVQDGQVNTIVPYGVSSGTIPIQIEYQGRLAPVQAVNIVPTNLGIFVYGDGSGRAVVVNEEGSFNSASRPARRGKTVSFFATGEGRLTNAADGRLPKPPNYPEAVLPIHVFIEGVEAKISFQGQIFPGVLQVNAEIPPNSLTGDVTFIVQAGGLPSPPAHIIVE